MDTIDPTIVLYHLRAGFTSYAYSVGGGIDLGQVKKRADGYIEKKRKINGKVVHFYGKTAREVQRKIDEALENAAKAKEESEVFDIVAEQWWEDYLKRIKPEDE